MKLPAPFHYCFWLGYSWFSAQLFAIAAVIALFIARHTAVPTPLIWPICLVTVWSIYPDVLAFNLANAVHDLPEALQATSITGVWGLDFTVALVNTSIYSALRWKRSPPPTAACCPRSPCSLL